MKDVRAVGAAVIAALLTLLSFPVYTVSATGAVYYVAADGSDANTGLSSEQPISFYKANNITLNSGDKMLFKRGDTFYGIFEPLAKGTNVNRVEIGAYGTGAKPIFSNAKIIGCAWTKAGAFYKFDLSKKGNYTGAKNDDWNVGFLEDSNGKKYYSLKASAADCIAQYDYYCSEDEKAIYIKTAVDPYRELGPLTLAMSGAVVKMSPGMNIHDLHIRYGGYGMYWGNRSRVPRDTCKDVRVYDCVIEDIGGCELYRQDDGSIVRAGNGIELYDAGSNVTIENNIFRNIYDVAFTVQGGREDDPNTSGNEEKISPGIWKNVIVQNNIFAYNTQALEIWCSSKDAGDGVQGLDFKNNLCIKQGEGWGTLARPEKQQATDVLVYGYSPPTWDMSVTNNTLYHSTYEATLYFIHTISIETFLAGVKADHNHIYQRNYNTHALRTTASGIGEFRNIQINFSAWQEKANKDLNSTWTIIGGKLDQCAAMEKLALTSIDFDAIAQAAYDAGLTVTLTFHKNTVADKKTTAKSTTTSAKTVTVGSTVPSDEAEVKPTDISVDGITMETTTETTVATQSASNAITTVSSLHEHLAQAEPTDADLMWWLIGIGTIVLIVGVLIAVIVLKKCKNGVVSK